MDSAMDSDMIYLIAEYGGHYVYAYSCLCSIDYYF